MDKDRRRKNAEKAARQTPTTTAVCPCPNCGVSVAAADRLGVYHATMAHLTAAHA